jgi:hypothetical protein
LATITGRLKSTTTACVRKFTFPKLFCQTKLWKLSNRHFIQVRISVTRKLPKKRCYFCMFSWVLHVGLKSVLLAYHWGFTLQKYTRVFHLLPPPRKSCCLLSELLLPFTKYITKHILITWGIKRRVPKVDLLRAVTMLELATLKRIHVEFSRIRPDPFSMCKLGRWGWGRGCELCGRPGRQSQRRWQNEYFKFKKNMIFRSQNMLNYWAK